MSRQLFSSRSLASMLTFRAGLAAAMLAVVPMALGPLAGCASGQRTTDGPSGQPTPHVPKLGEDFDRDGETVEAVFLTKQQLQELFKEEREGTSGAIVALPTRRH